VWSLDGGELPDGLSLSGAGVISGTPAASGTFKFTAKATNGAGDDTKELSIEIAPAPQSGDCLHWWTWLLIGLGGLGILGTIIKSAVLAVLGILIAGLGAAAALLCA